MQILLKCVVKTLALLILLLTLAPLVCAQKGGPGQGAKSEVPSPAKALTQEPPTQEDFLAELKARSRKEGAPDKIESFKITAIFSAQSKKGGKVDVEAEILFREPYYLRTTIKEGRKTIERGLEKYKAWMMQNDQAYALQGRDFAEDRQAVRRDAALARLTARFLYPDRVLQGLVDLKGPTAATYPIHRRGKSIQVQVWEMRGKAAKPKTFPLVLSPDHEGDIEIIVYFDKVKLEPRRVFLKPLDKSGKPIFLRTEGILFSKFKNQHGLRLPTKLAFVQPDPNQKVEKLYKVSSLSLKSFEIPKIPLAKSLFRMPK